LADAARIGNALRQFVWQGETVTALNFRDTNDDIEGPNRDEPELIVSREFGAESLLVPDNRILIRGCAPSLLALRRLFSKGIDLGKITWRELEEIIGELLLLEGYDVKVGRGTKDGGVDVLASKVLPHIGLLRTVWQAKHLQPGNKVELKTIRELADIRDQAQATKGIIVTTGFLTSGALKRIRQDAYRLGKMERPELECWIKRMLGRPK
jgi:restriction system protein